MDSEREPDQKKKDQSQDSDANEHDYVDRSKIDFDPDDGLYTGTAVDGTSDIPGPHEQDESDDKESGSEPDVDSAKDDPPGQDKRQEH